MIISQKLLINGVQQQLYLNLCSHPKNTLLFIHGGPGWADAPWAGLICKRLWGTVNTVHWDQRGGNRSQNGTSKSTPLTIEQMIRDALKVCELLRQEFQIEKPVLVGHSWGALLSVLLAVRAPELFHSYIGIGQLISNRESEPISLDFCKRKAKELKREDFLSELNAMPANFYRSIPLLFRQREILSELGGEFFKPTSQDQLEQWMLQSPEEYRSDWNTLYQGCKNTCDDLWPKIIEKNLIDEVQTLALPVTIIQGKYDYCTPSEPVKRWLKALSCSLSKELIEFEQSAHWPHMEENEKFSQLVLERASSPPKS